MATRPTFSSAVPCLTAAILSLVVQLPADAGGLTIKYVDDDAPPGGDGSSWENAFRFLADAVNAVDPDQDASLSAAEIRVAQGTYRADCTAQAPEGTGDRTATFTMHPLLTIRGGFAGLGAPDPDLQDPAILLTVLDGDLLGNDDRGMFDDNSMHVVTIDGAGTLLDGLVIRGGVGGFIEGLNYLIGGGVLSIDWPITATRCALVHNQAELGAAIYHSTGTQISAPCTLTDCLVADNVADLGAIRLYQTGGTLLNCVLRDNAVQSGGAIAAGTLNGPQRTVTLRECVFEDNRSEYGSGAAGMAGSVRIFAEDTRFAGNRGSEAGAVTASRAPSWFVRCAVLDNRGGPNGAGGLRLHDGVYGSGLIRISNCILAGNATLGSGGAVKAETAVRLTNCVLVQNSAHNGGGALSSLNKCDIHCCTIAGSGMSSLLFNYSGADSIINSIVATNHPPAIEDVGGNLFVDTSLITGGWSGAGHDVLDGDPLFVAPDAGDVRLAPGSPAIDAGSAELLPPDMEDLDGNGQPNTLSVDFFGAPRIQGAAPDLGAIEGSFTALTPTASVKALTPGATAELVPHDDHPWAGPPVRATISNMSAVEGGASFAQIGWTRHPDAGGFTEEGLVGSLATTIADGEHRTLVIIPFTFADFPYDVATVLRAVAYDPIANAWRPAVSLLAGDGSLGSFSYASGDIDSAPTPGGDRAELGDHGVFFDPIRDRGYVWAIVDIAGDFGVGRNTEPADIAPPGGDGLVDGADLGAVLAAWGTDGSTNGTDLTQDGIVDASDVAAVMAAWSSSS